MSATKRMNDWKLTFLMAFVISIALAACAVKGDSTPTETIEATAQPTKTRTPTLIPDSASTQSTPVHLIVDEDDLAGIVVRFVHPWSGGLAEALEDVAARFSVTNPWDIWVDVEATGGEDALLESLERDAAVGDVPGLIAAYPYQLKAFEGDVFPVNLTYYFNDETWGLSTEARQDIPPVFLEQFTTDGSLMALPIAPQAAVVFYNQTWAKEIGFSSTPKDSEAFLDQSCEATFANNADKNIDNDGTGGWLVNLDPLVLASWFNAFGGDLPLDGSPGFKNKAGEEAFGYLKSAYDRGCFWIGRQPEPYFYFANRYALSYAGRLDQIPLQMGWMQEAESADDWTAIGFPGPEGEAMLVGGPGLMVTADSPENQMAAWLFARYLLELEVQAELVQSGFTLPVRKSALALLSDFSEAYPQWAQAVDLLDEAQAVPTSEGWGVGQWLLQDALYQFLHMEIPFGSSLPVELSAILEKLDEAIIEMEGMAP